MHQHFWYQIHIPTQLCLLPHSFTRLILLIAFINHFWDEKLSSNCDACIRLKLHEAHGLLRGICLVVEGCERLIGGGCHGVVVLIVTKWSLLWHLSCYWHVNCTELIGGHVFAA